MERKEVTIDATGKSYGRLATEVATLIRGKKEASFEPHIMPKVFVIVKNLQKVSFTGKKYEQKLRYRHSGYPGGLKSELFKSAFEKNPEKTFLLSLKRMLPDNKLRKEILKHVTFTQ